VEGAPEEEVFLDGEALDGIARLAEGCERMVVVREIAEQAQSLVNS
jgi:hypothetical protein